MSIFDRMLGRQSSKKVARERLQLVLVHDRTSMSPDLLASIKEDILQVLSRRLDVDAENTEVELDQDDESMALVANVPVRRLRGGRPGASGRRRRPTSSRQTGDEELRGQA